MLQDPPRSLICGCIDWQVAITTPEGGSWVYPYKLYIGILRSLPPSPEKVGHTIGICVPYTFRTMVWGLLRPPSENFCRTGPTVFRSFPKRLDGLTVLRFHYKSSTFSAGAYICHRLRAVLSKLKALTVGLARFWTHDFLLSHPALSQLS